MPSQKHILVAIALLNTVCAQYGAMEMPAGLSPRQYLGGLEGRANGACASANSHTCLDVNQADFCCPNTEYCVVDTSLNPGCCAVGSNCGISCGSSSYICATTVTNSGTATSTQACCPRSCTSTSQFLCAATQGGGCCPYGYMCTAGSQGCVSTQTPTTVVASVVPSGCSAADQFTCASSLGGGCCGNGQACVTSGSGNFCSATGSALRTRTLAGGAIATAVAKPSGNSGLSTGAKAGIGVGVALGALAVIGALMWFFLVHRPRRQSEKQPTVPPAMSQSSGRNGRPAVGRQTSQPSDYFGPEAESGPFTENQASAPLSPNRGVPATPQSPGDIAVPVEIDSKSHSAVTSPSALEYQRYKGPSNPPVELP
ncbi:hypothetical protein LSUE1_G003916 [Lachnellula suecica]|uniref:Uncharacterized protein n=1 Tax=Lachnellula suecica TaxID=602035 RepID=A0A8T9C786_9HELO|nr:hypothetical protein LSUE1_G003916 [Lachnellula suecica]